MTTIEMLEKTAERLSDRTALHIRRGDTWRDTSWSEYRDLVRAAGKALIALGVNPGSGAAIIGNNRPEWFVSYLGSMAAGAIPSGIYATNTVEQCSYIAGHSESTVAFVEDNTQLRKFLKVRKEVPGLANIVLMEGSDDLEGVWSWSSFLEQGKGVSDDQLRERWERVGEEDLATLIYTSGTTGPPKAVMLSHRNLTWTAAMTVNVLEISEEDRQLSYLPLSHIAEQLLSLHTPLQSGAGVWFVPDPEQLGDALRHVRPTIFLGVPRVWEKIAMRMQEAGAGAPALRKKIIAWARKVGLEAGIAAEERRSRPWTWPLANKLVFSKVRERIGLDQARICITSAAPISMETLQFFLSLGIPIDEVYGMSECTGPTTLSMPGARRIGKAGMVAPGTELRTLDDGEILIRGPHVFMGYYKDEEATRATIDDEAWVHSGDVGEIDADGFLKITDRKKDLIITAGGHNISPSNIEKELKRIEGVSQALVIGDRRSYLVALLTLDASSLRRVAQSVQSGAVDIETARQCPRLRRYLTIQIDELNRSLARSETIKKFEILPADFDIDSGELTPTMKLRRRFVTEKYRSEIEALYGG